MDTNTLNNYAMRTLQLKGIDTTDINMKRCKTALEKAFNTCYYSVCLDIDGTICDEAENEVSEEIIDALTMLIRAGVNICFITGRGRSVRDILRSIISTIMKKNKDISFSVFKKWVCVIHNGVSLLSTVGNDINDFLEYHSLLLPREDIIYYQNFINKKIKEIFREKLMLPLIENEDYKIQLENAGTRFILYNKTLYDKKIDPNDFKINLEMLLEELKPDLPVKIIQSKYKDNIVFEYIICNKGTAIQKLEVFLGIPQHSMLRIGDQGNEGGNDYEMLNCIQGFSVKKLSDEPDKCFPFLNLTNYNIEEGPTATARLLDYFTLAIPVCLENPNKERYEKSLANIEKSASQKSRIYANRYSNIASTWISDEITDINSISQIFDIKSGAIKFKSWEWHLISEDNKFKKLFSMTDTVNKDLGCPNLKYALETDTAYILRGPHNYYYGLCYRNESKDFQKKSLQEITKEVSSFHYKWLESHIEFMKQCDKIFDEIDLHSILSQTENRKFLFGIMDCVRNMLLIILNAIIDDQSDNAISIWQKNSSMNELFKKVYDLNIEHCKYTYKMLFGGLYPFNINDYLSLFKLIKNMYTDYKTDIVNLILCNEPQKYKFRVWREIDVFMENVMAVDIALTNFRENIRGFGSKKIFIHGIRYGSIELPIICKVLGEVLGLDIEPSFVGLPGKYNEKHDSLQAYSKKYGTKEIDKSFTMENVINILTDDNLMTGRTIQILINDLAKYKCYPNGLIIVRYPSVNRIPHMSLENHGFPNVDLFFSFIRGLVSSTPYSRLFVPQKIKEKRYLDATNVFNKSRQRISRYLYKNGIFSEFSEIKFDNWRG